MADFNLDLRAVEEHIEDDEDGETFGGKIVLGVLDGTTDPDEWVTTIRSGHILVLAIEGDINELAAGFAREVRDEGGELVHFRGFLIVSPPDVTIDRERL